MELSSEQVNELIHHRRSVFPKDYTGETVSDAIVLQMLENACQAPTHKLTEPWHFVVFTGRGLERLAEFQADCYKSVTSADGSFKEDRYQSLLTKPLQSSHIIAIGMKRDAKKSVPELEEIGAVFCALENMYLTATGYGVGCYFSTGGVTNFEEAKPFFDLGPEDRLLGFLHIGTPRSWPLQGKRRPAKEKTKWVSN